MLKCTLLATLVAATSVSSYAADHSNDYKWLQFNFMGAFNELPGESSHDYLEMEFGGRSGNFDLYGYVDIFNLTSDPGSDKAGNEKIFMKFAPRYSIAKFDDSAFQELYVASVMEWGGFSYVNSQKIGIGSDVNVPWLGKIGLNLYSTYDSNIKDWNGFQISTNWFKPFVNFDNGSFISYQGYIDYQFLLEDKYSSASSGGAMFNGIYWHSDRFALGYGLKLYKDVYGIKDSSGFKSTGVGHYLSATYKF